MVGMGWVNEGVEKGEAPHPKKTLNTFAPFHKTIYSTDSLLGVGPCQGHTCFSVVHAT